MAIYKESPMNTSDVIQRVRSFTIGDKVQVVSDEDREEIVTIKRFYRNFVMYERDNGSTFTLGNFDARKMRLVKPSGFKVCNEAMDRTAVVNSLGDKKIGK